MDYREYAPKLQRYQEIENFRFPEDASQEEVIAQLMKFAVEKKEIQNTCNGIIAEYIEKYEKNPELLDEEAVKNLRAFAEILQPDDNSNHALDEGIAYRTYGLLFTYYEKEHNIEEAVTCLRWNSSYEIGFSNHMLFESYLTYRAKAAEYLKYFEQLSTKGKVALLNAYLSDMTMRDEPVSETIERYMRLNAFAKKARTILKEDFDELTYEIFITNSATVIAVGKNYEDQAVKVGKKSADDCTDISLYKDALLELLDEVKKQMKQLKDINLMTEYSYCLEFSYLVGDITLDELLLGFKECTTVNPEDDIIDQSYALFMFHGIYLQYLYLHSPKSKAEIMRESKEIIDYVMKAAQEMSAFATNFDISYNIMIFINAASLLADYKVFRDIVLDATVYANKALYVHTMMVKEISEILLEYLLEQDVEYLDGVVGYDTAYIKEHKPEIIEIMGECALLHDIGKYYCLDYTSNSYRRLTDEEFTAIKCHPENFEDIYRGAETPLAECIRDCAIMHHVWYNGKGGYPRREHTKNRPFVGILNIADSIDAALDTIGRPYGEGKTLDDLIAEFETMRDTRYSSRVIDALLNPTVKEKIETALKVRQKEIHYEAYQKVK